MMMIAIATWALAIQDPPESGDSFESLARSNVYSVHQAADGTLTGPGVEFLLEEAHDAQFIALGEEHNEARSNEFARSLFAILAREEGFAHLMVEQGSIITEQISRPGLRGDIRAISAHAADYPHAFTFVTDQELELLAEVGRVSPAAEPVWGCEIEFGVGHVLAELRPLLPDDSQAAHDLVRLQEQAGAAESPRSSPRHFIFEEDTAAAIARLRTLVFEETQDARARSLVERLDRSAGIFSLYRAGERGEVPGHYSNNAMREDYMIEQCLERYRSAAAGSADPPRAIIKLGHYHVMHGLNPSRVATMGSFFRSVARLNDLDFFLLGTFAYNPDDGFYSPLESSRVMGPVFGSVIDPAADFVVIDFRPFREYPNSSAASRHAGFDAEARSAMRSLFHAYDGALVVLNASQGSYARVNGEGAD